MIGNDILIEAQNDLRKHASKAGREAIAKFVPNSERIYGVRMPQVNTLAKEYHQHGFQLIQMLWSSGAFEERMLA